MKLYNSREYSNGFGLCLYGWTAVKESQRQNDWKSKCILRSYNTQADAKIIAKCYHITHATDWKMYHELEDEVEGVGSANWNNCKNYAFIRTTCAWQSF